MVMQQREVRTALRWFAREKLCVSEEDLFKAAYVETYHKAESRFFASFREYLTRGTVPRYVEDFIRKYFVQAFIRG